ncbi:hypothetical protein D3558_08750, partial [Campylobacter jejuni]|nr:hypothetical protein [Campylobacter jejuni]
MKSFNTIVTVKTIKSDSTIMRLNPISEAIKNAIDAKATRIDICFEECEGNSLFGKGISISIKDNGAGFNCSNNQYMENRWTHYKGGDYIKNTLGGRSRGRYSYLKFIDFENECLSDIKIYTKYNNKSYSVIFQGENQNIGFSVNEEVANHKENFTTKLYIKRLGNKFINGNTIEQMIEKAKKEIIVEFSDKLLKGITLSINNIKINVEEYIEEQLEKEYKLKNGQKISAYMVVWKNEIDLAIDKKHVFLFNIDNIPLGKIPSGCQKSIFNCHTVFLTSDCFEEDCEFIDINPDYKKIIEEVKNLYKPDLDKLLYKVWLKNADLMANRLVEESEFFKDETDEMIQEKIKEAYMVLSLPLLIKQHNINRSNASYFSNSLIGLISDNSYNTLENLELVFNLEKEDHEVFNYVRENVNILNLIKKYYNYISRLDFLQHFENLVLNEGKAETKERNELHKIVENNLWLFDEEYLNLDFFSDQSLKGIFNEIKLPINIDNENELNTIPDIFIPRTKDNELILIELKAPKVEINSSILTDVFDKYITKILKSLTKQGSNIDYVKAICISSKKQEFTGSLTGDKYSINPMTWKEIISTRKKDLENHIKDVKSNLSLSKYKDIHNF